MEKNKMKNCGNCGMENDVVQDFCLGCGLELEQLSVIEESSVDTSVEQITPDIAEDEKIPITEDFTNQSDGQVAQSAMATLVLGEKSYPINDNKVFLIAREGSPSNPDLPVPQTAQEDISSFPLQVVVRDGKIFVKYDGEQQRNYSVLKAVRPNEEIEVLPGEAIVAGMGTLIFLV